MQKKTKIKQKQHKDDLENLKKMQSHKRKEG